MSDLIDRKELGAAIDNWLAIDRYYHPYSKQKTIPVSELVDIIKLLPSAQPEYRMDEWCTDCKEYDQEKHCCPRFNHVIRATLQEVQAERKMGKWTINDCHAAVYKYHCSECGANHRARYDYCPSCGADMRGEQDG